MVEAAVVFPLLMFVALGLVQFALYEHAQNVVIAAAEDGARVAAAQSASTQDGYTRATTLIKAGLGSAVEPPNVTVAVAPLPPQPADHVTVTVSAKLRMILPWIPLREPYLPLYARAEMSKEHFRASAPAP